MKRPQFLKSAAVAGARSKGLIEGIGFMLALATGLAAQAAEWAPVPGHIMTRWAKEVSPENALPEYPRPDGPQRMAEPQWPVGARDY